MNGQPYQPLTGLSIQQQGFHPITTAGQVITREPETEQKYLHRAENLLSAAAYRLGINAAELHPVDFVEELGRVRTGYTKNTWYQYKSAVMFWLTQFSDEQAYANAAELLDTMKADVCLKKKTGKTSSQKEKRILEKDYVKLTMFLTEQKSGRWYRRAALFMQSSVAAGLRPCEWENAILHPDGDEQHAHPFLHVKNAKATNGRANGVSRIIPVAPENIITIERHLDEIQQYLAKGKDYPTYYHLCRNTFFKSVRELWPNGNKRYSFYSARHQFTANMKSTRGGEEVQGMMGHASITTHKRSYAKSRSAWSSFSPKKRVGMNSAMAIRAKA